MKHKVIVFGAEARKKIVKGVDTVSNAVKVTLGPAGRNAIWGRSFRGPEISNDGKKIAEQIILEDEIENLGVQAICQASNNTNTVVGDGTTTSIVLAQKIIEEGMKRLDSGQSILASKANAREIVREINEIKEKVFIELDKRKKPIETVEDLIKVATASIENAEYGKIIGEMRFELGKDGFVYVEEGFVPEVEHEVVKGYQARGTYVVPVGANNQKQVIVENVPVLITNEEQFDVRDLAFLVDSLGNKKESDPEPPIRKLVVMSPRFSKEMIGAVVATAQQDKGNFFILAVKIPSLTDDQMEDIAFYTGAVFFDQKKGKKVKEATVDDLGAVGKIIVDPEYAVLMDGKGSPVLLQKRIQEVSDHIKIASIEIEKNILKKRLSSLAGGIGIIRVGAKTEGERGYWKDKFDDAVPATKAAYEDGVVPGGGVTLKEIGEILEEEFKGNILSEALKAPYNQIQENAGGNLTIMNDILDPVKVTKTALENACSVAGVLLSVETAICEANPPKINQAIREGISE